LVILNLPVEIKSVNPLVTRDEQRRIVSDQVVTVAFLNGMIIFYNIVNVKIYSHIFKEVSVDHFLFKNLDFWPRYQKFGRFELNKAQ
jgi:hypothetical protein